MTASILSCRTFFKHRTHAAFQVLRHMPPGFMVDIGAAAGYTASMMVRMSPLSTVLAFEPFPGNHKFFEAHIESDQRVTLDKRAVSDRAGIASFVIPGTVSGSEASWEKMTGYSTLGMLAAAAKGQSAINVETCRLDEVVNEHIRFMKVDTQGAEIKVLRGCERLFEANKFDVMHIEFDEGFDIMEFLLAKDFTIIDTETTIIHKSKRNPDRWHIVRKS